VSLVEAVVLGIVQGITEFLPISSTAHLRVVPALLGWGDPGAAYSAVIQIGTVLAVLVYFRKDLVDIGAGVLRGLRTRRPLEDPAARLGLYIALGTLPIVFFGLLFEHRIKSEFRSLYVIAASMIVVGVIMGVVDRRARRRAGLAEVTLGDALWMGIAQSLALVPGVSRSGSTITAGLLRGMDRAEAARFSFLLSIPAVTAAGLKELWDLRKEGGPGAGTLEVAVGIGVSFVVGYLAIAGLIAFLKRRSLMVFVVYRIALGVLLLALLAQGILEAQG
jgi:undecaprenyl-diphosphatase